MWFLLFLPSTGRGYFSPLPLTWNMGQLYNLVWAVECGRNDMYISRLWLQESLQPCLTLLECCLQASCKTVTLAYWKKSRESPADSLALRARCRSESRVSLPALLTLSWLKLSPHPQYEELRQKSMLIWVTKFGEFYLAAKAHWYM